MAEAKKTTTPRKPRESAREKLAANRLQALSTIVSRAQLAASLGQHYGGERDIYDALGYKKHLVYDDFLSRYERQDIAQAVIDRPVDATWLNGFELVEKSKNVDKDTTFEKAWKKLAKEHKLASKFRRLDRMAAIGRYGALFLGLTDARNRDAQAKKVAGTPRLLFVKPLGEGSAEVRTWERSTTSPRFGLPTTYNIAISEPGSSVTGSGQATVQLGVHWSRVLHVVKNLKESETEGQSDLEVIFNRLMDLEKLTGGSAEMFWRGARPGYQGKVDSDFQLTDDMKTDLQNQLDEFEHELRRVLVNEGVSFSSLAQQVADPGSHVDIQLQMISAVTGIPKRILTGSERGELASTQDMTSWFGVIAARREEVAEGSIIRPFVNSMIEIGVLPEPKDEYNVKWADLFADSEKDKAEVGRTRAGALKEYAASPTAEAIVPPKAFLELFLGLDRDQIDRIEKVLEEVAEQEDLDTVLEEEDAVPGQFPEVPPPDDDEDEGTDEGGRK